MARYRPHVCVRYYGIASSVSGYERVPVTGGHAVDSNPNCILLVEDNEDDAAIAMSALKEHARTHDVVVVKDGAEARDFLNAVGAYKHRYVCPMPDLILMDIKIPKVDGLQVLKAMRSEQRTKSIPVVVLTSSRDESDVKLAYAMGANSYIRKPVNYDDFSRAIRDVSRYWLALNSAPPKVAADPEPGERSVK